MTIFKIIKGSFSVGKNKTVISATRNRSGSTEQNCSKETRLWSFLCCGFFVCSLNIMPN